MAFGKFHCETGDLCGVSDPTKPCRLHQVTSGYLMLPGCLQGINIETS